MKEITSHTNEYIKILKSLKRKKARDEFGKYIIEGMKTIKEAYTHKQEIESILISGEDTDVMRFDEEGNIETITVPYSIIQQISDTKTPPQEIACLKKKENLPGFTGKFYVALDDISDPKNLGTIIRTADAGGADGIFISDNSADYYGPKAQRAAMGSTFHVPIEVGNLETQLCRLNEQGIKILSGSLEGSETMPTDLNAVCVVIGNEARGISARVKELSDVLYKIKIYGQAESLNASVAAGIMIYEIRKNLM